VSVKAIKPLRIYLLGQFKLLVGEKPLELPSRPAQSLLAYLALNAGVTQRREKLACLLWPEASESNARGYLRQALWRIRKAMESGSLDGGDYLQVSDIDITFDEQSDYWLDVEQLLGAGKDESVEGLIEIVQLYRGELLPGFYDEWVVLERDRLEAAFHQKMNLLLEGLIEARRWDEALKWGEEWIRLGYGPEAAYRALMRAHAGLGDQGMVEAAYQRCVEALDRALEVEPSPETQQFYTRIHRGELDGYRSQPDLTVNLAEQLPLFLENVEAHPVEKHVFVARERELAQLDRFLKLALAGQGRVAFVTGEAGGGKTALIQEFTRRSQEVYVGPSIDPGQALIVAGGNCNAHTGVGDPYLPFREILDLLAGDIESRWAAGAVTREHARRLWNMTPSTSQALVEAGPDLIDTFVPGVALVERATTFTPRGAEWLTRLGEIVERKQTAQIGPSPQQSDLFDQFTRVLHILARQNPLVLILDDLQWADLGSISLLFHLGRRLVGSRILVVGVYRSEEVALGRDGTRHPLEPVVNELHRELGNITVDLGQAESRDFMEALLDSEPNRLGGAFRDMLYLQTRGQPLFTVELLRGLQERGDLARDPQGCWIEGPALDWKELPARVDAVIAERVGRLSRSVRSTMRAASIEGEVFTAEVLARVQATDERQLVKSLSSELDRRHHLISAQAIERLGEQRLSRYRFRHSLVQKYLYDSMDEVERAYLHEDVGNVLEELYGDRADEIAVQLARHFQEAGVTEKAVHYLHQAGERALRLSAYQEAIAHLDTGLELLMALRDSEAEDQRSDRAHQELALQLTLGIAMIGLKGFGSEVKQTFTRARELCQQLGETAQLSRVVGELSNLHYVHADYLQARQLGEEALSLAQDAENPLLVALGHWHLGFISFGLGDFPTARDHLQQVIPFYKPQQHHRSFIVLRGSDAGVGALAYDACCLWCLGYPDQAALRSQEALALARELDHPYTLIDVLAFAGCVLNSMRREAVAFNDYAEEMKRLASNKLQSWLGMATWLKGEAVALSGYLEEGIAQMQEGLQFKEYGAAELCYRSGCLRSLAEAQAKLGHLEDALSTLVEAFALMDETGERYCEAELHRLKGGLLLSQDNEAEAEASFLRAIQVARRQSAKSWELRATTDLARLLQKQGRGNEARQALAEIYNWFTEGFDTFDLQEARELLEQLI
jgi:DNA-binding SARP family transcriptional activator/predicted ATPase